MLALLIIVPILILSSIIMWYCGYVKNYKKRKEEALKNKQRWYYDNYFEFFFSDCEASIIEVASFLILIASIILLFVVVPIIVCERSDIRVEYDTAIIMRESYSDVTEHKSLAYSNAVKFNETVAKHRSSQDKFLLDIYYPDDCDWNNIELIDISEIVKEDNIIEDLFG